MFILRINSLFREVRHLSKGRRSLPSLRQADRRLHGTAGLAVSLLHRRWCIVPVAVWAVLASGAGACRLRADEGIVAQAFAPRSVGAGSTMFTRVDHQKAGVITENPYDDARMWTERYRELALGAIGTGVAVGDYDNDGRPDVFIVSKTRQSRLFRNLGGWKFEDVTDAAGLGRGSSGWRATLKGWLGMGGDSAIDPSEWKQGASFADVNNDGFPDLYLCRFAAPNLLYINQGNGTFREEAEARGVAVTDGSGMAAFHDYDRDGWLDLYLQTNILDVAQSPDGQGDYLFRNRGDGTFENLTDRAGISGLAAGHSATWWDFDNDGWPDIYVANDFATPDNLYRNNRDGTFTDVINEVVPHTLHFSMGADIGDVNNDGLMDLFVADMAATTHEKNQRSMAGNRARAQMEPADPAVAPQYMRNVLYVNTDTGHMLEAAALAGVNATDWTWSVRFEDLDNDGRVDLHATNGMIREYHGTDLLERIMVTEDPLAPVRIMRESPVLSEANMAFRNLGGLRFENVGKSWGLDQHGVSFGAALGDFDGDGDLDLVLTNLDAPATLLRNDGGTGNSVVIALQGTVSNRSGIGSVVRIETASGHQVRHLVLARGSLSNSEPVLHFGLGEDGVIKRLSVSWPSGHVQEFTDLPVNRRFAISEPSSQAQIPSETPLRQPGLFEVVTSEAGLVFESSEGAIDESVRQPLLPFRQNRRGPGVAVGDVDGDRREDVIFGGTSRSPAKIFLKDPSGPRYAQRELPADDASVLNDGPVLLVDLDGNGTSDLLRTKGGTALPAGAREYQPVIFLNNGRGGFRAGDDTTLPRLSLSVGTAAAADFNRDGLLDLFLGARVEPGRYPLAPSSVLLVNRGGRFENATETLAPALHDAGMVTSALWSDVDEDGWLDLLLASEWGGVVYLRNDAGNGFEDRSREAGFSSAGTGWWSSLAAADFNGDGRVDYAAGNVGLNTPYHASEEGPALLYLVDSTSSGSFRIVEAHAGAGAIYPWRSRNELVAALPFIGRRFADNSGFALAQLGEILGEDRMEKARRFAATEFRSGVFLSEPGGKFRFASLPRLAQISPVQGMVAGDFDGDGKADIYALQNSHAPVRVIGRFDGGLSLLLRGDAKGNFEPVSPAESGLVVPGDAKALAVLDLDANGWPDFLATRNSGTSVAFQNRGAAGRRSFSVSLRGAAGNPTAVGARVTVTQHDGSSQTCEVHAGSGYYAQSSASCFFGYKEENPPRTIRVRWPAGATSEHAFRAGGTPVILEAPGS